MKKIVVRIETNNKNEIVIKRTQYSRFEFYEVYSYTWNLDPKEISISQKALDLLKKRVGSKYTSLGDLAGLDLFYHTNNQIPSRVGYGLNYGFLGPKLNLPLNDVLIDSKFYQMLSSQAIISDQTVAKDPEDISRWVKILKLDKQKKDEEANQIITDFYTTTKK